MRWLAICLALVAAAPAVAQDRPGFLQRLFGTDSAASDAEQGTLLERLLEDSLSGAGRDVTITGFRGALSGQATLDSLTISDEQGVWLSLTDATLDWRRAALFRGALDVTELSAREIVLARLPAGGNADPPTPEARGFQLPELPVSVDIKRILAERVELGEPVLGVAAAVSLDGSLSLANGNGAADIDVTRLDRPGTISLDASFSNATEDLSLDLSMSEAEGGILATLAGLPGQPSVDFSIAGEGPLSDFSADIRLATNEAERLSGQITVGTVENARRIVASLGGDITPIVAPQYRSFFGDDLTFDAETLLYDDGRTVLPSFSLFARELALFGSMEFASGGMPEVIDITGRVAPEAGDSANLPIPGPETRVARANLAVTYDAAQSEDWLAVIRLNSLSRDGLSADDIALRATGRIATAAPAVSGDITFELSGFETTDGLSEAIGSDASGTVGVGWAGGPVTIEDFTLQARDLNASGTASIEGANVTADANLTANRLANFATLTGQPLAGRATLAVSGMFNPLSQVFDLRAEGETVDLSIGDPRADAILDGTARLDATAVRDTDGLRFKLTTLESEAASLSGQASLRSGGSTAVLNGRLNETSLVLPGLSGPSDITFSGQEDEARDWAVSTTLTAPALRAEFDGLLGDLYDQPTAQGTLDASSPDISVFSELAGRSLGGQLAVRAEVGANSDLSRALVDADFRGRDISIEGLGTDRLLQGPVTLQIEGARTGERVEIVDLSFGGENLIAQLSGVITALTGNALFEGALRANAPDLSVFSTLANRPLSGQLNIVAEGAVNSDLSTARIDATADGQDVAIGVAEIDTLLRGPLQLDIDAARDGERIELSAFSLRSGSLNVTTSGQLGSDGDRLQVAARLDDLSPFLPGFNGALAVAGSLGLQAQDILLDLEATGPGGTRARVSGTARQSLSVVNVSIDGTAPLALANRFIAPRSVDGVSSFALRLDGQPTLENLSGQVRVAGARLAAPTLRNSLTDITGTVTLANAQATLALDSRLETGGSISVAGPVGLSTPNNAALQIELARARLTDPQLFETIANGRLRVDGPVTGGAAITGRIDLGETNIRIPSTGLGGTGAIPEIIHINEPPPVRATRRKAGLLDSQSANGAQGGPVYALDILISAPNRVFVRGRGLDSEFGGSVRVTGSTANVVPIGAFELIRGRLDILGRRLALDEARITVQGGFIPVLDIRATTQAEDTAIGVEVLGPADSPEIRFTSSPQLPQEEVLARLIFGRGLETLSPLQAARLALAVRTLAGQGGEGIVGNIRGRTGLADLDVTTNEDGNAAVRAGAYLGENIYSDVTVDTAGETQLNLNLDVTPSLTVRGGVTDAGESSLGIFFERDY
jgi:translocation and assembly module TamB